MTKKHLPTPDVLRQLLRYNAETGNLFWREASPCMFDDSAYSAERKCKAWNGKYSGKIALNYECKVHRYKYGEIFGVKLYAHRVIIAMTTNKWPDEVDHINGNRGDNRLPNLRPVTRSENMKNSAMRSDNTSGTMGVYWDSARGKWSAEIYSDGKKAYLGRFSCKSEAIKKRLEAEKKMGFHKNHGRISASN